MNTHYCIIKLENGQPARGMYTCSAAYGTPELALQLGPGAFDGHQSASGKEPTLALARMVTTPDGSSNGCRLVSQTVLRLV